MCNTPSDNGISLHTFPKADILKSKWLCAIQLTVSRARWRGPRNINSQLVCSEHFEKRNVHIDNYDKMAARNFM